MDFKSKVFFTGKQKSFIGIACKSLCKPIRYRHGKNRKKQNRDKLKCRNGTVMLQHSTYQVSLSLSHSPSKWGI